MPRSQIAGAEIETSRRERIIEEPSRTKPVARRKQRILKSLRAISSLSNYRTACHAFDHIYVGDQRKININLIETS